MTNLTTETQWQTRARHDADELRRLAEAVAQLQTADLNAESFGAAYVRLSKEAERLGESMWQAAMAAWAGDLWPND
jgi:hypothetical protein